MIEKLFTNENCFIFLKIQICVTSYVVELDVLYHREKYQTDWLIAHGMRLIDISITKYRQQNFLSPIRIDGNTVDCMGRTGAKTNLQYLSKEFLISSKYSFFRVMRLRKITGKKIFFGYCVHSFRYGTSL